jgi:sigma-B regulation protein RsbQ
MCWRQADRTDSRWCLLTGSALISTCGAKSRHGSRATFGSFCSTTLGQVARISLLTIPTVMTRLQLTPRTSWELDLARVVFVGHSVSAMIGVLAALEEPDRFARLVLVGPSPRYIDDRWYVGGFGEADIADLLESLDSNYLGWSSAMAPVIMGNPERPELGEELTESFCRTDPQIARQFARVTFLSDNRADLDKVTTPTLVLQCREDAIAPVAVGEYVAHAIADSRLVLLDATGHCPNLSAPDATAAAIADFVRA